MKHLWQQWRVLATKYSLGLIWVWAGSTLLGLGVVYHRQRKGERVGYSRDDLQPDPEVSLQVMGWVKKLGLDQTIDKPRR